MKHFNNCLKLTKSYKRDILYLHTDRIDHYILFTSIPANQFETNSSVANKASKLANWIET